jgi:hypothetical protein
VSGGAGKPLTAKDLMVIDDLLLNEQYQDRYGPSAKFNVKHFPQQVQPIGPNAAASVADSSSDVFFEFKDDKKMSVSSLFFCSFFCLLSLSL